MHTQVLDAFADYLTPLKLPDMRLFNSMDGHGFGQIQGKCGVTRIKLAGRPDGLRPGGRATMLDDLRARGANRTTDGDMLRPLDWMELDREYAQYHERSLVVLGAAVREARDDHNAEALALCRLCCADVDHQLATIEFVKQAHPAGRLTDAQPAARPALAARKCVAAALACALDNDPGKAERQLHDGVAHLLHAHGTLGTSSPTAHAGVQRLRDLAQRLAAIAAPLTPPPRELEHTATPG